jgi:hypothetical protein
MNVKIPQENNLLSFNQTENKILKIGSNKKIFLKNSTIASNSKIQSNKVLSMVIQEDFLTD